VVHQPATPTSLIEGNGDVLFQRFFPASQGTASQGTTAANWIPVSKRWYLDPATVRYQINPSGTRDSVTMRTKIFNDDGTYSIERFQINRRTRKWRTLSWRLYRTDGTVSDSSDSASTWIEIIPESNCDVLFQGLFPTSQGTATRF